MLHYGVMVCHGIFKKFYRFDSQELSRIGNNKILENNRSKYVCSS